jgi:F-type H+-transporting ATPase subunit a
VKNTVNMSTLQTDMATPLAPHTAGETAQNAPARQEQGTPEIANFTTLLSESPVKDKPFVKYLHHWENSFFSFLLAIIIVIVVIKGTRRRRLIPARLQNFLEYIVEAADEFLCDLLGKKNGRRFLPYLGSLFIFILCNNLMGLIPLFKSPTSSFRTTVALGIITFFYVQYVAIRANGVLGYLYHLAGTPRDVIGWLIVPLILPLHIVEELAKPLTLSLRLFGNILGEDTLLGAFVMLGITVAGLMGLKGIPIGVPLQFPFFFLATLTSIIQAMVFAVLATTYILLVLPHEEEQSS